MVLASCRVLRLSFGGKAEFFPEVPQSGRGWRRAGGSQAPPSKVAQAATLGPSGSAPDPALRLPDDASRRRGRGDRMGCAH